MTGYCLKDFYCFGKGLGWKGEGRVIVLFFFPLRHRTRATISQTAKGSQSLQSREEGPQLLPPQEIARAERSPAVEVPRKLVWGEKKASLHGNCF